MIKFTIKHTCGHVVTHVHSGGEQELQRRKASLGERPCSPCNREARTSKASAQKQAWNLLPLEGTPEDIDWAEVIRLKAIGENRDYHQRLVGSSKLDKENPALRDAIVTSADAALQELHAQRSATWWIDNRFDCLTYVKRKVTAAITPIMESRP